MLVKNTPPPPPPPPHLPHGAFWLFNIHGGRRHPLSTRPGAQSSLGPSEPGAVIRPRRRRPPANKRFPSLAAGVRGWHRAHTHAEGEQHHCARVQKPESGVRAQARVTLASFWPLRKVPSLPAASGAIILRAVFPTERVGIRGGGWMVVCVLGGGLCCPPALY